ncbi:RraA family protein [Ahrensia sp. R2A130]|uniref:RraA family protein n=1 Tax=Ahrensia sp. R2A130 TaxID=744979 RepID=UPI0001E094C7|nr:RraA family protein [Ahrensia sp. R2A130]EFL88174.1 dimethylmenaquinone methyltransferase [Ahrensia sp. R2A130]
MSYKLNPLPDAVDPALLERLSKLETATIGHTHLFGFADPALQAVVPGNTVVGTAVTLAVPGADSTLLHDVVGKLRPGDFLAIDRLGDTRHACFGGGVANAAKACGFAGAAVDGAHTDTDEIAGHGFPVWSRGPSPITTRLYDIGGGFNIPVSIAGAAVLPGYAVLADDSGVLFIAPEDLEEVISVAETKTERGNANQPRITAGEKLGELSGASAKVAAKSQAG